MNCLLFGFFSTVAMKAVRLFLLAQATQKKEIQTEHDPFVEERRVTSFRLPLNMQKIAGCPFYFPAFML